MRETLNCVKDLKKWLGAFGREQNLPQTARELLNRKAEEICKRLCKIKCENGTLDKEELHKVELFVLDCKDWLAAFAEGYELPDPAVNVLYQQYDLVVHRMTQIQ